MSKKTQLRYHKNIRILTRQIIRDGILIMRRAHNHFFPVEANPERAPPGIGGEHLSPGIHKKDRSEDLWLELPDA